MEDTCSSIRRWEDMDNDILVKIFQNLDIFQLTSGVAHVCHTWRNAACDPLLWRALDLSLLRSNYIKIPLEPYVYVDGRSDKVFTRVLKISLNLSRGSIVTLIFHYNMYVSDDHLTYTAESNHWILTIIDPHKEMVSLVDPLSHRNRDSSWKEVVNKAMTMFNAKIGRRGKKQPNWEIIKAPIQPDNKQCGFFVMRYMREIIDELADNGSISLKSHFEHRRYSQEEIDEVRIEWANCVLEHI